MEKIYKLPVEDVNEDSATITDICFKNGQEVIVGDKIYEFETTKANAEVHANESGFIFFAVKEGESVKTGATVAVITPNLDYSFKNSSKTVEGQQSEYTLTQKAQNFAELHNIDLASLALKGIVRVKDLQPFANKETEKQPFEWCEPNRENPELQPLFTDSSWPNRTSNEKIEYYKKIGYKIGKNVTFADGSLIIANSVEIADDVTIAANTILEAGEIKIEQGVHIGNNCTLVASRLHFGEETRLAENVNVDLSGGRHADSNLITGRGCLIASQVYINVAHQVLLGNEVALSPRAMIFTHSFWQSILEGYSSVFGPVKVEDNAWVGAAAQILPNVTIGSGSILTSNSVAIAHIKKEAVAAGNPARIIREQIKKKKTAIQVKTTLNEALGQFAQELQSRGIKTNYNSENFKLTYIYDDLEGKIEIGYTKQAKSTDLLTVLKREDIPNLTDHKALVIESKKIYGTLNFVENLWLGYLRRRGIRFYK